MKNLQKLFTTCVALLGASVVSAGNVSSSPCGPLAAGVVFLIDYSGSMNQTLRQDFDHQSPAQTVPGSLQAIEDQAKLQLAKKLTATLGQEITAAAQMPIAVSSLAPQALLVDVAARNPQDLRSLIDQLPVDFEVFGRQTNLGEGFASLEQQITRWQDSSDPQFTKKAQTLAHSVFLVITDTGTSNRGRSTADGLKGFQKAYPQAKIAFISLAAAQSQQQELTALGALGQGTYDAATLLADDQKRQRLIAELFYRSCAPATTELNFTLAADALFNFDKADLKPAGRTELQAVATSLAKNRSTIDQLGLRFAISAHTDRIGTDSYNDRLSQRRLHTVLQELEHLGVDMSLFVKKEAAGKRQPITGHSCSVNLPRAALISCLQPDRRVEIRVVQPQQ